MSSFAEEGVFKEGGIRSLKGVAWWCGKCRGFVYEGKLQGAMVGTGLEVLNESASDDSFFCLQ